MNAQDFLTKIIENFVASVPQLVALLGSILFYLKKVRATADILPTQVNTLGDTLGKTFTEAKENLISSFTEVKNNMESSFEKAANNIDKVVSDAVASITSKVNDELIAMKKELSQYKAILNAQKEQSNLLARENVAFMQLLSELLEKDYDKIKSGVAQKVLNRFTLTKEELQKYPDVLVQDSALLEKALKEIKNISGVEKLDTILKELGYERKEKQEKQETKELQEEE